MGLNERVDQHGTMLRNLTINNFTLVKDLDIEISPGMSVVTGETGAGKSIMLDALSLTLGSRADSAMIALDTNRAEINATFDVTTNHEAQRWLNERELSDDNVCILRRVLTSDGRSRGFINGVPSTLADMQDLGNLLADIHSQHEHQSLLKPDTHRRLLDEFGVHNALLSKVQRYYQDYVQKQDRLRVLVGSDSEGTARLQLLQYQIEELAGHNLSETLNLEQEQRRLANAESILSNCHEAIDLCRDNDGNNVSAMLIRTLDQLTAVDDPALLAVIEMLTSSQIQVEEAINDLASIADNFSADPGRLMEVEDRLSSIYDLARKHRVAPTELDDLQTKIQEEIASLEHADVEIETLQRELLEIDAHYQKAAALLSKARQKSSAVLEQAVCNKLADLGMGGSTFSILLKAKKEPLHLHGSEDIEFLVSTNPKQPVRPLARVASGGELSRISLAIQVVTANTSRVPTLVFDEVDVGIGGAIAEVVGSLLRHLGESAQIICVTHLPQVAAQGHHHLHVTKDNEREPMVNIEDLTGADRISEVARMLGGIKITDQSLAHAEQMLANIS
jgi:DNA repair protein RecN (Recombination protein N)